MRALSWKEPFATLMLHGKIETRTWNAKYRGLVLICASKQPYTNRQILHIAGQDQFQRILSNTYSVIENHDLPLGHAIAVGNLVDSRPMLPEDEEKCFVEYYPGLWCHVYTGVTAIKPIPWKGGQGWRTVPQEFIDKIEYLK